METSIQSTLCYLPLVVSKKQLLPPSDSLDLFIQENVLSVDFYPHSVDKSGGGEGEDSDFSNFRTQRYLWYIPVEADKITVIALLKLFFFLNRNMLSWVTPKENILKESSRPQYLKNRTNFDVACISF